MKLSVILSILTLWTLIITDVQPTSGNNVSDSHLLHLEQTVLDLQSQFQAQEQKYAVVLSSVLSKLSSTTDELESVKHGLDEVKMNVSTSDELSSVKTELRNMTSDFEALEREHLDLKHKMKEQENKTVVLESVLTASDNNLQSVVSTEVLKLTSDMTLSIKSVQSNVSSVASEQVQLSGNVDNMSKDVSQLKASYNSDSTCSMSGSGCPLGFISHGSSCYLFSRETATFPQAHSMCQFLSSHLVAITSSEEKNFIRTYLVKGKSYFIGGSDLSQEGTWTLGCPFSRMTYTNWAHGQPDHNGNCLLISTTSHGQWGDISCSSDKNYICERKAQ